MIHYLKLLVKQQIQASRNLVLMSVFAMLVLAIQEVMESYEVEINGKVFQVKVCET